MFIMAEGKREREREREGRKKHEGRRDVDGVFI